jgi:hypothetical protein
LLQQLYNFLKWGKRREDKKTGDFFNKYSFTKTGARKNKQRNENMKSKETTGV